MISAHPRHYRSIAGKIIKPLIQTTMDLSEGGISNKVQQEVLDV
jgi:hypothetical protein